MISKKSDWYKEGWTLNIKQQSWTEDTKRQVDFLIDALSLKGGERILDLACGFGRHSLELARRGFEVVGIDITKDYIEYAAAQAKKENLNAEFFRMDIRDASFENEFDIVLNMADGAIGYLENDDENLKIFNVAAKALKSGGRHFMDIMNADYADSHFPCNLWDAGREKLTLSKFEWDKDSRIMLYGQNDFTYGEQLNVPKFEKGDPIRLYNINEIGEIMRNRKMRVVKTFGDFSGAICDKNSIQMMVVSQKD